MDGIDSSRLSPTPQSSSKYPEHIVIGIVHTFSSLHVCLEPFFQVQTCDEGRVVHRCQTRHTVVKRPIIRPLESHKVSALIR